MSNELVLGMSATVLVARWNQVKDNIKAVVELCDKIDTDLTEMADLTVDREDLEYEFERGEKTDKIKAIEQLRSSMWSRIIERTEIKRVLSKARVDELDKSIATGAIGEITEETLHGVIKSATDNMGQLIEEVLWDAYKLLVYYNDSGRRQNLKTNRKFKRGIGHRVILPGVSSYIRGGSFHVSPHWENEYRTIARAMQILSGLGVASKSYYGELAEGIARSDKGQGETVHFRFKCYKNGHCHVELKDRTWVDKLNQLFASKTITE